MAVIGVSAVVLIVLTWFLWPAKNAPPAPRDRPDVDETELEA